MIRSNRGRHGSSRSVRNGQRRAETNRPVAEVNFVCPACLCQAEQKGGGPCLGGWLRKTYERPPPPCCSPCSASFLLLTRWGVRRLAGQAGPAPLFLPVSVRSSPPTA